MVEETTPLIIASEAGDEEAVERILKESNADDINATDSVYKRTALFHACHHRHERIAVRLIDAGADFTVPIEAYFDKPTYLYVAVNERLPMVAERLLQQASPDYVNAVTQYTGETVFFSTVSCKRVEMALRLINHGADVKLANSQGITPLMEAAMNGLYVVVERILKELGDASFEHINLKNKHEQTALSYACINEHVDIVRLLLKHGADPRIRWQPYLKLSDYLDILSIMKDAMDEPERVEVLAKVRWLHDTGKRTVHVENHRCPNENPLLTNVVDKVLGLNDDLFGELREMMAPWWVVECT